MQLTIPDCCLGEFCPGIHVEGHRKREDGTYYSTDDHESNAYHYHNTDGSAFYRYSDGSEYYRRKNGNITFRAPPEPYEKVEEACPIYRPWYDWPPKLNLSVKTDGTSVIIHDVSGSTVTFEPVGSNARADLVPVHDKSISLGQAHLDRDRFQASPGGTFGMQEWAKKPTLADIISRGEEDLRETGGRMIFT